MLLYSSYRPLGWHREHLDLVTGQSQCGAACPQLRHNSFTLDHLICLPTTNTSQLVSIIYSIFTWSSTLLLELLLLIYLLKLRILVVYNNNIIIIPIFLDLYPYKNLATSVDESSKARDIIVLKRNKF